MTTQGVIYEKMVIGGIINGYVNPLTLPVDTPDFEAFGNVLLITRELYAEDKARPITADLLEMRLRERFPDEDFYNRTDFAVCAQTVSSASGVLEAADKVKAAALRTYLTTNLANILADETRTGAQMLDRIKEIIAFADSKYRTRENNFIPLSEIVPKLRAVLTDLKNGVSYAVPTGFASLDDDLLDGFSKSDAHVIVGRTGHGKSALALNAARYQAAQGIKVGVVSREMSDIENAMRLQSARQQIPRWQMRRGIQQHTYDELMAGLDDLGSLPIWFDVRTPYIEDLQLQVKRNCEEQGLQILYVDTVQLVATERQRSTRAEAVGAVSRGLKEIAMENQIPVVELSQFSRSALTAGVEDLIECLKESSGIEQDASTITYVQIDKTDPQATVKPAKIQVLKNRNGVTFNPRMFNFRGETFTFSEAGAADQQAAGISYEQQNYENGEHENGAGDGATDGLDFAF